MDGVIPHDVLVACVNYVPESGWFVRKGDTIPTGRVKGGYRYVKVGNKEYPAHRLAYYYMTGTYPPPDVEIDHDDSDSLNNRWANLKPMTRTGNRQKRATPKKYRKALAPYVYPSRKHPAYFEAFVRFNGRKLCVGSHHRSVDDAVAAQKRKLADLIAASGSHVFTLYSNPASAEVLASCP